jgi:squalene-associated FAD-dependent desaturase
VRPWAYIIGAGLAGLAAAVRLSQAGVGITLFEAAKQAGGRCRSFYDETLKRRIDNGNHLLLTGNTAAFSYLADIGAADRLVGPERAEYRFTDLATGRRWLLKPNRGRVPWWIFAPSRRVPGTRPADYGRALKLAFASASATVSDCLGDSGAAFARFWEPLAVAVLNTAAAEGAARLLWPVVRETFGRGEAASRPRIAAEGLSETFVDPALACLDARGARLHLGRRVQHLAGEGGRIRAITLADGETVAVGKGDAVILAVPAAGAARLLPALSVPEAVRPIVNGHFRLDRRLADWRIEGVIGGLSQWVFVRGDVASVTVSAAVAAAEAPAEAVLARMWREVAHVLALGDTARPLAARLIKERRATFAQTPEEVARRPGCRTPFANLWLAGDWTDTGLPATIEGSVRSGNTAAAQALAFIASS